jgi:hypothetical protein
MHRLFDTRILLVGLLLALGLVVHAVEPSRAPSWEMTGSIGRAPAVTHPAD